MDDKTLFYQVLKREIDNLVGELSPSLRIFSNSISNYVIKTIDPYIDAFMFGTDEINTEAAGEFVKEEVNTRIDNFMKKFNNRKTGDGM